MSSDSRKPFSMVPDPPGRSVKKPRQSGLTMMMDWGLPSAAQADWLELIAPYVDLAKLVVGTARLYDRDYLLSKLALYRQYVVAPFIGGQFLEFVYATQGFGAVAPFCEEAIALGVAAVEVSDNVVALDDDERRRLIAAVAATGLEVHGEVGSKSQQTRGEELIAQARLCLEAGASVVLIEGAELLHNGTPDQELIELLGRELDASNVLYELSGPWVANTHWTDVLSLKSFLVRTFGPDVNLANVMPDAVFETEALRRGLSTTGPPNYHHAEAEERRQVERPYQTGQD